MAKKKQAKGAEPSKNTRKTTGGAGGKKTAQRKSAEQPSVKQKAPKPLRSTGCKVTPYLLILLGLILGICLIIVRLAGLDDGAGAIGYGIQWFFGGLFGGATVLLPAVLIYIGLKWCLYNVKWKEIDMVPSSQFFGEYRRAKHRLGLQIAMSALVVLSLSMMMGVLADYDSPDVAEMWEGGAEELFEGGGILGGIPGYGMTLAFQQVISMVLLAILLAVAVIFMIGLTPDFFMEKIQQKREEHKEEKAYLAAQRREDEARRRAEELERKAAEAKLRDEERRAAAASAKAAKAAKAATKQEEVLPEEEPKPVKQQELSHADMVELAEAEAPALPEEPVLQHLEVEEEPDPIEAMTANLGKDYGGDSALDTKEYDNLDEFFKSFDQKEPAKKQEKAAAPVNLGELGAAELLSDVAEVAPEEGEVEEEEPEEPAHPYIFPPMDLMARKPGGEKEDFTAELQENARQLLDTLKSFRISIKSIDYSRGPTITRYELRPDAGVRVRSISNLVDDIALSLATSGVRIEAPIPGKPAVGIEVPNRHRETVYLRELVDNAKFTDAKSKLTAALGMDVGGNPIYFDITKMPHMIIAGATGMGKSVCINGIIISILYKAKPDEVKLILIDPKKVEFNLYKDIPHLYAPIVSEPKKAAGALASAVAEMERRFELIEEVGVRDITSYNAATENDPYKEKMPHMVIIIDELADLMMTAPDDVEASICRLAQKARAAGIHIIIGTQRPSVDVITGLIKANIPSRIACTVASQVDSRTIIDIAGAEKLIGRGDMLFAPVGAAKPLRVQGAFVTENEVESICTFIRENNSKAKYNSEFVNRIEEEAAKCGSKKGSSSSDSMPLGGSDSEGGDSKFHEAVKLAVEEGKISTSLMQRRLGVGYGRAAKIIDTMEQMGYVSKPDGNKPRRVLLTAEEYSQKVMDGTLGDTDD